MKLPRFEYVRAETLREACRAAVSAGQDGRIIAGGTDILQSLKYRIISVRTLIDIRSLPDLSHISYSDSAGFVVVPLVTLRLLAAYPAVKDKYPLLAQAALSVGSTQLQAMGTIGGNLCQDTRCIYFNLPPMSRQGLDPCYKLGDGKCHVVKGSKVCLATYTGDLAPALLALQAEITVAEGNKEIRMPLIKLFSGRGKRPLTLLPGQVLKEIHVPPPTGHQGVYLKMRQRKSIDYPLLGVAVNIVPNEAKGTLKEAAVALTAAGTSPLFVAAPAALAEGRDLSSQAAIMAEAAYKAAHPMANMAGYSPNYRREMVKIYVTQAIMQAMAVSTEKGEVS